MSTTNGELRTPGPTEQRVPGGLTNQLRNWRPGVGARIAIAAAFAASALLQIVGVPFTSSFGTRTRFDMDVYRLGGQIWHQGFSLYADGSMPFTSDGIWLPFTYPPFAALLFTPLGAMPLSVASIGISLITAGLLVYVTVLSLQVLEIGTRDNQWWLAVALSVVTIWFNPFWMTLGFGQINVVLMAMILVDIFVVPRIGRGRAQGILIGLAAAIKLTPLVFLGVFLVAWRLRSVAVGVASFIAAAAVGWIWMPDDSRTYWTDTLFHTARIGQPEGRINQNLMAAWLRVFGDQGSAAEVAWIASSLAVTVLALLAVLRARPVTAFADGPMTGRVNAMAVTCAVAVWGLLVSPTTWAHHWVWCIPSLLLCLVIGYRSAETKYRVTYFTLAGLGALIFAIGVFQLLPPIEHGWAAWEHLIGNSFTLWGIALLVALWRLPCEEGSDDGQTRVAEESPELAQS
ncbi:glycosyltransferase 87 family protein [Gordonia sp. (in: high G+C Gram-positive bacteria)]|uniref:glycosyltransferase 87 family protein n=1 Tax=Gordonia sp. (in: high G+C Gram-positive bacteria) TaxID=84139 RepID=UPI003C736421